jgi:hypothetical protein
MTPITFSRQVDFKTLLKVHYQLLIKSNYVLMMYFAGAFSLYLAFVVFEIPKSELALFTIAIIILMITYPMRIYKRAKTKFDSSPLAGQEAFWKIDDNGIEIKTNSSMSSYGWDVVIKITEDKYWVFLWFNKANYTFFPKSELPDDELQEIKRLVFINRKVSAK